MLDRENLAPLQPFLVALVVQVSCFSSEEEGLAQVEGHLNAGHVPGGRGDVHDVKLAKAEVVGWHRVVSVQNQYAGLQSGGSAHSVLV
jgi:hypothetical protein